MNQEHLQSMFHASEYLNMMYGNATRHKNQTIIIVSVCGSAKNQQYIMYANKFMLGILLIVLGSVTKIVKLASLERLEILIMMWYGS